MCAVYAVFELISLFCGYNLNVVLNSLGFMPLQNVNQKKYHHIRRI